MITETQAVAGCICTNESVSQWCHMRDVKVVQASVTWNERSEIQYKVAMGDAEY